MSPSGQNTLPIGIDMLAHLGCIVALAVQTFVIALSASGKLIVVELDAKPGLVRNANATVDNRHTSAGNDFVSL